MNIGSDSVALRPYSDSLAASYLAGSASFLLGTAVLIGWTYRIQTLKSVFPGLSPMAPNAAAGFALSGAAVLLLTVAPLNRTSQWIMRAAAALVLLLGASTLSQYTFGFELGIDELIVRVPTDDFDPLQSGRLSALAAGNFVLLATALLLLDRCCYSAAQFLALVSLGTASIVLGGYLFGLMAVSITEFNPPTTADAALGFLFVSIGVLASRAESGFIRRAWPHLPAIGFGSTVALLSLASAASYIDTLRIAEATSLVEETHDTQARLNNISLNIERVVTTARIFVLTGEENFVAMLAETEEQIKYDFTVLHQTFAQNNSDLRSTLATLEALTERRLALSSEYIDLRRRMGLLETTERIPVGGERLAADIRGLISNITQVLQARLDQNRAVVAVRHAFTLASVALTTLLSVALLFFSFAAFRRRAAERIGLEREIVATAEHERNRIGHDLHDNLGQLLTGISWGLDGLAKTLERDQSAHVQTVLSLRALTRKSIEEIRRIAWALSPNFQDELGIRDVLTSLAHEVGEYSGVNCNVHGLIENEILEPQITVQLYRIAQEALNNALRHGNPKNIGLRFERTGKTACLSVTDDGIGISPESYCAGGIGLSSMRYRARIVNGVLDIASRDEGGTVVRCTFKCPGTSVHPDRIEGRAQ